MINVDLEPDKKRIDNTLGVFQNFSEEEREIEKYRVQLEGLVIQNKIRRNLNIIVWVILLGILLSAIVAFSPSLLRV